MISDSVLKTPLIVSILLVVRENILYKLLIFN